MVMMMKVLLLSFISFLLRLPQKEEEECVDDDGLGQSNSLLLVVSLFVQ